MAAVNRNTRTRAGTSGNTIILKAGREEALLLATTLMEPANRKAPFCKESLREFRLTCARSRAVVTVRDHGATTDFAGKVTKKNDGVEKTMLLRTYNHWPRPGPLQDQELNPRELLSSQLDIATACSCTTAAPMYFRKIWQHGRRYIDGGVVANNPAVYAWNEATQMAHVPRLAKSDWQPSIFPQGLVSIGTGRKKQATRFGGRWDWMSWLHLAMHTITETQQAHYDARCLAETHGAAYFRFDVPESGKDTPQGMPSIKLDECKKSRKRQPKRPRDSEEALKAAEKKDRQLQDDVRGWDGRGKYDPDKYTYKTFDELRDRTVMYLHGSESSPRDPGEDTPVQNMVEECARLLLQVSRDRRAWKGETEKWERFRKYPGVK